MSAPSDDPNQEQPFMSHLLELRDRLLRMVAAIFVVFLVLFPFANDLYVYVATPLMSRLPAGTSMIATGVAAPFLTPFKLSLMAAVFLSMPFILYQTWAFVAPGLYKHEKKLVIPLLVSSSILFYLGMLFAYYVVFPLVFAFFIGTTPDGVAVMTDISQYLDFVLTLFFAFGVAFEVPIATILLVWMGMATPQDLGKKRPYIIVGAFVVGMFLTPPDVISQTLLALPIWVLFELGVQFSKFFVRERNEGDEKEPDSVGEKAGSSEPGPGGGSESSSRTKESAPESILVGAEISGGDPSDPDRFVPMTDEEMEAELDLIDAEEAQLDSAKEYEDAAGQASVEDKLRRVQTLRDADNESGARELLNEILADGDEDQRRVARNILQQLNTL